MDKFIYLKTRSSILVAIFTALVLILSAIIFISKRDNVFDNLEYIDGRLLNRILLDLPSNQWIEIYPKSPKDIFPKISFGVNWYRQGHAGLAFDSKRGTLIIFGSNSHNENWDNSIHEFNPVTLEWWDHYSESPKESYRSDKRGIPIAGESQQLPWAMHTYDSIAYFPELDSLVVTSKIDHTPAPTESAKLAKLNPTWIYNLESKQWQMLVQENHPSFFASGSSYDPITGNLWAYKKNELWQLDSQSLQWKLVPGKHKTDLAIHFTMVTDSKRHQLVFFGNYNKSNSLWFYTPAIISGQEGKWEQKQPTGDTCPKDEHLPVAYDKHQEVFLLVPDENNTTSVTMVYLPDTNEYIRVPGADLPANKMNYMMEYDPYHRVFYLIHGEWPNHPKVLAFRLDIEALRTK